jgi:hypothetical protein
MSLTGVQTRDKPENCDCQTWLSERMPSGSSSLAALQLPFVIPTALGKITCIGLQTWCLALAEKAQTPPGQGSTGVVLQAQDESRYPQGSRALAHCNAGSP